MSCQHADIRRYTRVASVFNLQSCKIIVPAFVIAILGMRVRVFIFSMFQNGLEEKPVHVGLVLVHPSGRAR